MLGIVTLLVGLATLLIGGDLLVRGASALAWRLRASALVAGLVVGFGTSAPELMLSVNAALQGIEGLAIGTIIGANVANAFLVLGVLAVVAGAQVQHHPIGWQTASFLALGAVAIGLLGHDGTLGRLDGAVLLVVFAAFLIDQARRAQRDEVLLEEIEPAHLRMALPTTIVLIVAGLALLPIGATIAVAAATGLARTLGVSEALIGLTVTSFGTTLPEVATAIAAGRRRDHALGIGNVVGSLLFNTLFIIGIVAAIRPVSMPPGLWLVALPAFLLATLAVIATARGLVPLWRGTGIGLLGCYLVYVGVAALWG